MRYMVKCPYCDKTYMVDASAEEADFACESCGAQNGKADIVERVVPVVTSSGYAPRRKSRRDPDLEAIQNFDISKYKADGSPGVMKSYEVAEKQQKEIENGVYQHTAGDYLEVIAVVGFIILILFGACILGGLGI